MHFRTPLATQRNHTRPEPFPSPHKMTSKAIRLRHAEEVSLLTHEVDNTGALGPTDQPCTMLNRAMVDLASELVTWRDGSAAVHGSNLRQLSL